MPTTLVAAFKSTLEEAKSADLLLHVVDASHPEYRAQYDTVNQLVKDLDMDDLPQAIIFNKKINVLKKLMYRYQAIRLYLYQVVIVKIN